MDTSSYLLVTVFKGCFGAVLLLAAYFLFDFITPDKNFNELFKKDTVGSGAVIVAAFLLGIALIVSGAPF